jgi:hypothetical protein
LKTINHVNLDKIENNLKAIKADPPKQRRLTGLRAIGIAVDLQDLSSGQNFS